MDIPKNLNSETILLARQPIVASDLSMYAYELLYRPDARSGNTLSGDEATRKVLVNSLTATDLDSLVGSNIAFINMTRQTILEVEHLSIPTDRVMFEILEDIELDDELLKKIEFLKTEGYRFALDDFTLDGIHTDHVPLAEVVKVDIQGMSDETIIRHAQELKAEGVTLLAEKVETWREFHLCKDAGFELFQGYFYAKPQLVSGAEIQQMRTSTLSLIERLQDHECSVDELERLITQDPALTYKLFKYANSAALSKGKNFNKIKDVVVLLGMEKLRGIVTLFSLSSMSDKPLVTTEAVLRRAYICSLLAKEANKENINEYFTLGMFSLLDAYLDRPIYELLESLPLDLKLKDAIIKRDGFMGKTLLLAQKLESMDTVDFDKLMGDRQKYFELYQEATRQAREVMSALSDD